MVIFQEKKLMYVDHRLQLIVTRAARNIQFDILIACGYRSNTEQLVAYLSGRSKAKPGLSKHNKMPSLAIDIIGCTEKGDPLWKNIDLLFKLDVAMRKEANLIGVELVWSKTWKKFVEFNHWELKL